MQTNNVPNRIHAHSTTNIATQHRGVYNNVLCADKRMSTCCRAQTQRKIFNTYGHGLVSCSGHVIVIFRSDIDSSAYTMIALYISTTYCVYGHVVPVPSAFLVLHVALVQSSRCLQ